jgi:hypothetical protein
MLHFRKVSKIDLFKMILFHVFRCIDGVTEKMQGKRESALRRRRFGYILSMSC